MEKLLIFFLFLFLIISPVEANEPLVGVTFKDAELSDVLRGLADIGGINILISNEVKGRISAHLQGISFSEAWEGILYTHGLDYYKKDNLYLVGCSDLIAQLSSNEVIKVFDLEGRAPDEIQKLMGEIFPELKIALDINSSSMICSGEKEKLKKVEEILSQVGGPLSKEKVRVLEIDNIQSENAVEIISQLYPGLTVITRGGDRIIVKGFPEKIKKAKKIIEEIDYPLPQKEILVKELEYGDPEIFEPLLQELFSEIEIKTDKRMQRLLLKGKPENLEEVVPVIEEMDQPRELILVEFRIEEVSSHFIKEKGLDLGQLASIDLFEEGFLLHGEGIRLNLENFLNLMEEEGVSETLARPSLTTLEGIEGILHIGDRIPVRGERINNDGDQRIDYLQTGIIISFTPRLSEGKYITLEVRPEVSKIGEELVSGFPRVSTREVETVVRVECGETFALGGLLQVEDRFRKKELPWFRKLPLIGSWLGSNKENKLATELIIFITPRVIRKDGGKSPGNQEEIMRKMDFKKKQ